MIAQGLEFESQAGQTLYSIAKQFAIISTSIKSTLLLGTNMHHENRHHKLDVTRFDPAYITIKSVSKIKAQLNENLSYLIFWQRK